MRIMKMLAVPIAPQATPFPQTFSGHPLTSTTVLGVEHAVGISIVTQDRVVALARDTTVICARVIVFTISVEHTLNSRKPEYNRLIHDQRFVPRSVSELAVDRADGTICAI